MSAYRWRDGGGNSSFRPPPPPPPAIPPPPDPRYHGYRNYHHPHNNSNYTHAPPPPQHRANLLAHHPNYTREPPFPPAQHRAKLLAPQATYNGAFHAPGDGLHRTPQYNHHLTVPVQRVIPIPVQYIHPASFIQFLIYFSAPSVGQISRRKPSKPCKKVQSSDPKQASDDPVCTSAPPIAVNPPVNEKIQWPKPDIELVVKNISKPLTETQDSASEAVSRKRKRNKKAKVKKEPRPPLTHYYTKRMVRDPWFYLKLVVGIIVKKRVVDSMFEHKEKPEGSVKVDFSEMSLADCLDVTYEETVNGCSTDIVD